MGTPLSPSDIGPLALKVTARDSQLLSVSQGFSFNVVKSLSATNTSQSIGYVEDRDHQLSNVLVTTPSPTVTVSLTLSDVTVGSFFWLGLVVA